MRQMRSLIRLSPRDWAMIGRAYWWLLWARWDMLKGQEWLESVPRHSDVGRLTVRKRDDERVTRRVRSISLASRYPYRWSWCLQSSLALRAWLARIGVFADLRIGVRKDGGDLQAHAWLEYGGEVLNDDPRAVKRFVPLTTHLEPGAEWICEPTGQGSQ